MSIYSGFGTRQQETHYNRTVEKIIYLLSDNIIYTYLGETFNEERWFSKIRHCFFTLSQMEPYKYLKPKFSEGIKDLVAAFSNKYISRENSLAGTDLDLRTEKSYGFTKKQRQFDNSDQYGTYDRSGFLAVPSVTTAKRPPRPQINFPHSAGRNKSTSPGFVGAPTTEYYPTAKNSTFKRKDLSGQNASVIENLETRLNQNGVNDSMNGGCQVNDKHSRTNSRHSQPELKITDIAARPADLSTLQTNHQKRKNSGNRLTRSKMESNKSSMTNSRRMLANSGMQYEAQIRVSQRKLKSAGRRTGPYKVVNYPPPSFSRESSGASENYKLDSSSQGRANQMGPLSGKNSQLHPVAVRDQRKRNDLQDASLEEISNFLIERHEQQNAINFFHKRPGSREGRKTPTSVKRPQSGVVHSIPRNEEGMQRNSTRLEQLERKQRKEGYSEVPLLDV